MELTTDEVTTEQIQTRVAAHPFFAGMKKHHIDLLARHAQPVRYSPNEFIFLAGTPADGFYLIETGSVALEGSVMEHGPVTTDTVRAGEPLGWSWLFPPYCWHFDARAIEPTTAIFFNGETLRKHYEEDLTFGHDLFKRMSQVMAHRLQAARRKLVAAHPESKRN